MRFNIKVMGSDCRNDQSEVTCGVTMSSVLNLEIKFYSFVRYELKEEILCNFYEAIPAAKWVSGEYSLARLVAG